MTTKLMPMFLMLVAALLVAIGYCLLRLARQSISPGERAGMSFGDSDLHSDDPGTRKH